jgi:polyisoprenoid-binding protein YceI
MNRPEWIATALLTAALVSTVTWAQETGLLHFKVNPRETSITASVAEPMALILGKATASFRVVSGEVQGNPNSIADTGKVNLVIDAASYKTDSQSRDTNVKNSALEVEKFPTITFSGRWFSEIHKDGERSATLRVLGQLTLHGVTREITVPLTAHIDDRGRFVADGSYTLRYAEYGVKRPSMMMGLMATGDEATIDFHVVADPV